MLLVLNISFFRKNLKKKVEIERKTCWT